MKLKFLLLTFILISSNTFSQLYINEFMASNASTIEDPDFNQDADWIELYNDGESALDLNGYFLTDNLSVPEKWMITNVTIPSKGYAIFWADGNNIGNHTNFKLDAQNEKIGLFRPNNSLEDSVLYSNQQPDVSQGRNSANINHWGYFSKPTPNAPNSSQFYSGFALNEPIFNIKGGIYPTQQSITLSTDLGGEIRYTLDGSEPNQNSSLYSQPITIDKTTIVRARIFKPEMLSGTIITNSYFINESIESNGLSVVSISSNPENFWDPTLGIYAQSFKPDWEIPVNIELFDNNGSDRASFNEIAGVKINGLYSWQLPQKMLGVYFKKRYGSGTLDYSIFDETPRSGFKTFALRASGNDWSNTLMRDILGQNATLLNMKLDISAYRRTTVYFNGQYMGIHNFREKIETDYIEKHYGLEAGTFDMVENEDFAECGDLIAYNELKTLFSKDLSLQSNYDAVAEKMNIENFSDLVITELASGNSSIDHNVMAWKPKDSGKWKWIVMDLDRGFGSATSDLISFYIKQTSFPFSNLMKNSAYVNYFGKRLADHLYSSYYPATMQGLIKNHHDEIALEMPKHIAKWLGQTSSYGDAMPSLDFWENEVEKLNSFVEDRPAIILNDLTKYGFSSSVLLTLSVFPENAGVLKINNFKIAQNHSSALYPQNINSQISAVDKAGYSFKGWVNSPKNTLIPKQATWKYIDDGADRGTSWKEVSYNDVSWKSGQAKLGYGDGNQMTTVSYGSSSSNKYITTYFRKVISLSETDLSGTDYWINLLKDDGAIIYVNGVEIIRDNIKPGTINYKTLASDGTSGVSEKTFNSFYIDKNQLQIGTNVIAVEVHQSDISSSDLGFDMELCYYKNDNVYVSTDKTYDINLTGDLSLIAVYEQNSSCVVPDVISDDMTLYKSCSPYIVRDNVIINKNTTLTIEAGVEILLSPKSNVFIHGKIEAIGTLAEPIKFKMNPQFANEGWGALNFWNTTATSNLTYVTIEDATKGPVPQRVGAINTFYGNLNLDHLSIENTKLNPISARYSDIVLTNSYIHSEATSDLINVKYGHARIEDCIFVGNAAFDSDGIDYDGIENGVIRNTKIINILGNNADAIDIGEEAHNIIIDSVLIYNAFDKGVSVGQRSSVLMTNSQLVNCNMGAGVKDSSSISINQCLFYGNGSAVSCYEKNPGRAGGNAKVYNSILSNSSKVSYESDDKSSISFKNSLSDNDRLPDDPTNYFGNPLFSNPTFFDLSISSNSPAFGKGYINGQTINIGTNSPVFESTPDIMICKFYINPLNTLNPEYIAVYNPSNQTLDLSNYSVTKGINCIIPTGTTLMPGDTLFLTSDATSWDKSKKVIQWTDGKLSNSGEEIEIINQYGMVADHISYNIIDGWPHKGFDSDMIFVLKDTNTDNHFGENWIANSINNYLSADSVKRNKIQLYPNPATDRITIEADFSTKDRIEIYSTLGQLMIETKAEQDAVITINVSDLKQGIYIVKVGKFTTRVLIKR